MSVLVKGMEMPDGCFHCILSFMWFNGTETVLQCNVLKKLVSDDGTKDTNCPLVEVPPHRRLIDADALIEDLERQCKEVFRIDAVSPDDYWITRNEAYNEALWKTWVESFDNYLKTRPTVILADEEGET